MRVPPFSRTHCSNRKPRPPDKSATAAFRSIHRRRLSSAIFRKGWFRRRGLRASCSDDRLSAFTDDLLLLILRRLDTRTALATATLSKRWACFPRGLDCLDFKVSDILPPRYHRCIHAHREGGRYTYGLEVNLKASCSRIERYQRRAMRAMVASIKNFLDADDDHDRGALGLRNVRKLRLEFFVTQCSSSINRLITKAVDSWGVEDLEVSAQSMYRRRDAHSFFHHGLCNNPQMSRLTSLKLTACYFPPLKCFHALTSLVLQDLPKSTPTSAYESIFTLCPQLQSLHLKSCMLDVEGIVAIDAPRSEIKQFIMEDCPYGWFKLHALPMLERMAIVHTTVIYRLSCFPYLRHFSLTKRHGYSKSRTIRFTPDWDLDRYLGGSFGITSLIVRFTGYDRWFKPWSPALLLPKLRRLLIADVPSSWDVSWPRLLVEAAPCLESLHIHISPCEEDPWDDITWQSPKFSHSQLKELVIVGFEGTERQIYFVNFVTEVSTSLQLVSLYKKGHVQDRGRWDWAMVTQRCQWVEEEKVKLLNRIADNFPCAATPIQIVLQ